MADEKVEISRDSLSRLQSAAQDFARAEIDRIECVIIEEMRSRTSIGAFGGVCARHVWDEYCWALQEGPFDVPTIIDATNFGSLSDGFDDLVHALIVAEIERLSSHQQIFLSALAFAEDADMDEEDNLGCIWVDGIVNVVAKAVNERASRRNLELIGPDRADTIGYEIQGTGFVWSALDRSLAMDLVRTHVDSMIDPHGDLSLLADEIVEAYLTEAKDEDGGAFSMLVEHFGERIRSMIMEQDVLPSLEDMRRKLLKAWDG
jgi:hypothetical protein